MELVEKNDKRTILEYVRARIDGDDKLADAIWKANPDLQERMIVAIIAVKGEMKRDGKA